MPMPRLDLKGIRTETVVAVEYISYRIGGRFGFWRCRCDCGGELIVESSRLVKGIPKTCRACRTLQLKDASAKQRKVVVAMHATGMGPTDIAAATGLSRGGVHHMLNAEGVETDRFCMVNHDYFEIIDTEAKAYWLGFLMADGCVTDEGRVCFVLKASDREHVELFRSHIGSTHAINVYPASQGRIRGQEINSTGSVGVSVRSKKMTADLARCNILPRKSLTAEPWIGPPGLMRHYWRGAVDGDGWIYLSRAKGTPFVGLIGSLAVVNGFCEFARTATRSRVRPRPKGKVWTVQFGTAAALDITTALYQNAGVVLPRKQLPAERAMAWVPRWRVPPR